MLACLLLSPAAARTVATKKYLPARYAAEGAVALDGSPFAYYLAPGDPSKFVIFQKGGGWCYSDAECAARALTELGSSNDTFLPPSITFETFSETAHFMLLFSNASVSPLTHTWTSALAFGAPRQPPPPPPTTTTTTTTTPHTHPPAAEIYLPYLDGSSQTGDLEEPVAVGAQRIFYRGARIHRATLAALLAGEGLAAATDVVLAGGSAGALATYLHADSWRDAIVAASPAARVVAVPDSGFFLDYNASATSRTAFGAAMRWVFARGNGTGGVPAACLAANAADPARCIFAEEVAKTLRTPTLAQQSTYDSFQVAAILQQPASNASAVNAFGALLAARVRAALVASSPDHGVFLDSCFHHVAEWGQITIDGDTIATALAAFYGSVGAPGAKRVWAQGEAYPCAACCKNGQ